MTQPQVRVYLFTCRRNALLRRAVDSLLRQTRRDWVCELHNDAPDDDFPARLVGELGDPRIAYRRHERNLGAVASFNLAFQPVPEPFVSILEDDNWWEPRFLEAMLDAMAKHPASCVGWANMWMWQEMPDGSWQRGRTIWPRGEGSTKVFEPPHPAGICQALHSQGAMLVRNTDAAMVTVPPSLPVFAIEPVRERAVRGPLVMVTEPLANLALTAGSARTESADDNMGILVLLARSFLAHAQVPRDFYRHMWDSCAGSRAHKQRAVLVAAILARKFMAVVTAARLRDLALVAAWALRHPFRFAALFRAPRRFPEVDAFLDKASRKP